MGNYDLSEAIAGMVKSWKYVWSSGPCPLTLSSLERSFSFFYIYLCERPLDITTSFCLGDGGFVRGGLRADPREKG